MVDLPLSETRYANASDGVRLAYRVLGDGPVDLLWSFSQLSDVEAIWEYAPIADFLRVLAADGRLIVHDRRGMGRSSGDMGDLETDVADLSLVLDTGGVDRPYLVGAVIGGSIYTAFAARHPERVAGLAWHGAFARSGWAPDYPWAPTPDELDRYQSSLAEGWGTESFAAQFVAAGAPSMAGDRETVRFFAHWMRQTSDAAAASAYNRAWDAVDLRPLLTAVRTPTLITSRGADPAESAHVASLIAGARFVDFDGADFMPFYGAEPIIDTLRAFVFGSSRPPPNTGP